MQVRDPCSLRGAETLRTAIVEAVGKAFRAWLLQGRNRTILAPQEVWWQEGEARA